MTTLDVWNLVLIAGGAVLMFMAAGRSLAVRQLARNGRYESAWEVLYGLMVFFSIAYILAVALVIGFGSHSLDSVVGAVFVSGAGFVLLVAHVSLGKLRELKEKEALLGDKLDATDRALQEKARKLDTITSAARDAIIMIDDRGLVTFFNPAAEKMFDFGAAEMLGKNFHELVVPKKFMADHRRGFAGFVENGAGTAIGQTLELEAARKDGTVFPVEVSVASIGLNGKWFAVGTVRDITVRKESDDLLKASRDALAAANEKLTRALADQQAALEEIRTLHGLIPICSHCHKVRTEEDVWQRVDVYVQEHSNAKFSHSICDACLEERYPDD